MTHDGDVTGSRGIGDVRISINICIICIYIGINPSNPFLRKLMYVEDLHRDKPNMPKNENKKVRAAAINYISSKL